VIALSRFASFSHWQGQRKMEMKAKAKAKLNKQAIEESQTQTDVENNSAYGTNSIFFVIRFQPKHILYIRKTLRP
jgi:hypothetical protein